MTDIGFTADIIEKNEEQRIVYGFASVIEDAGGMVVDSQGDIIDEATLVKAAHEFVKAERTAKAMHQGNPVGEIVESIVLTKDVQKAMGIKIDKVGWFIGMKIHDDNVWKQVKAGTLAAFSIGGRGHREAA